MLQAHACLIFPYYTDMVCMGRLTEQLLAWDPDDPGVEHCATAQCNASCSSKNQNVIPRQVSWWNSKGSFCVPNCFFLVHDCQPFRPKPLPSCDQPLRASQGGISVPPHRTGQSMPTGQGLNTNALRVDARFSTTCTQCPSADVASLVPFTTRG